MAEGEPDGLIEGTGAARPQPVMQVLGTVVVEVGGSGNYEVKFNNLMVEAVPLILEKAAMELKKKLMQ